MKKRIFALVFLLIFLVLSLSSCVRYENKISVTSEGYFDVSIFYAVNEKMLDPNGAQSSLLSDTKRQKLEDAGWYYMEYNDGDYRGFTIIKKNLKITSTRNGAAPDIFSTEVEDYFTRSGNAITFQMQGLSNDTLESLGVSQVADANVRVCLSLPGEAIESNADIVSEDKKSYTWDLLDMGEGEELYCTFTIDMDSGLIIFLIAGSAVIIFAVLLILVVKLRAIIRKKRENAPGA